MSNFYEYPELEYPTEQDLPRGLYVHHVGIYQPSTKNYAGFCRMVALGMQDLSDASDEMNFDAYVIHTVHTPDSVIRHVMQPREGQGGFSLATVTYGKNRNVELQIDEEGICEGNVITLQSGESMDFIALAKPGVEISGCQLSVYEDGLLETIIVAQGPIEE